MKLMMMMLLVVSSFANAQWQPCGVAVCDTPGSGTISKLPEIAPDGRGGAYVVWRDLRNGVDYDVYAQRVDSNGVMRWQDNGISIAALPRGQDFPVVCSDGAGGMFAAWEDSRSELNNRTCVFAQRVDRGGNQLWQTNGVKVSEAPGLFVRMAANRGGVVMGWIHFLGIGNSEPFVQRLDSFGQRVWGDSGIRLSNRVGALSTGEIAIASDGSGGAIIAWIEGNRTYAQRVDSAGQTRWQANGISLSGNTQYNRFAIAAVCDMQGGAFVTWTRNPNSGVYLQHVNGSGQVLLADTGLYVSPGGTARNLVSDGVGGAIVFPGYVNAGTVVARLYRYSNDGHSKWPIGVPVTTETGISETFLSSDGGGGAFVLLTFSGGRVKAQWIDSSGTVRYDSNGVVICNQAAGPEQPRITAVEVRKAIAVWNIGGPGSGTYTSVFAAKVSDTGIILDVPEEKQGIPSEPHLFQNYPNPFNPETTIEFSIPKRGHATLKIIDVLGRVVDTLIDEQKETGIYRTQWKAANHSSGPYFYTFQLDGFTLVKKMILLH